MFKKKIDDGTIQLILEKTVKKWAFKPVEFHYAINTCKDNILVGHCDFRLLNNNENYFAGNIGYMIYKKHRGNNYAYMASRLLCSMAKDVYDEIIITCSPDNIPSDKIISKLGGKLIDTSEVPSNHFLFRQGEKIKKIYTIDLKNFK